MPLLIPLFFFQEVHYTITDTAQRKTRQWIMQAKQQNMEMACANIGTSTFGDMSHTYASKKFSFERPPSIPHLCVTILMVSRSQIEILAERFLADLFHQVPVRDTIL